MEIYQAVICLHRLTELLKQADCKHMVLAKINITRVELVQSINFFKEIVTVILALSFLTLRQQSIFKITQQIECIKQVMHTNYQGVKIQVTNPIRKSSNRPSIYLRKKLSPKLLFKNKSLSIHFNFPLWMIWMSFPQLQLLKAKFSIIPTIINSKILLLTRISMRKLLSEQTLRRNWRSNSIYTLLIKEILSVKPFKMNESHPMNENQFL